MKRYKRLMIMAAVLVVACIATFALTQYEEKQEQIRTSDEIILQIPTDTVQSLSWEYSGGGSLAFNKTDDGWKYQEDEAFPVSEEKVMAILEHFEEYGVTFVISDVTDYGQYGLDDPEAVLHLATGEQSYDLKMGAFSKMDEQRYIDIGDGNVYLVKEDPIEYIDANLSSMILHDDTPGFETVVDISFAGAENYTVVRTDESTDTYNPEDDIYFVEQGGKTVPLDTAKVRTYLNTVTSLDLLDYVTYNATEEELQTYGLDDPMLSVTVNFTYTETDENGEETTVSDTCIFHISENPEERAEADKQIAEGNNAGAVTKYVRIGDSQIVYTMDDTDFAILKAAAYDDLRHGEVFWADFKAVTRIDIDLEGEEHTLVSELNEDEERVWYYGEDALTPVATEETTDSTEETQAEEDVESLDISGIESALLNLTADSFTDELPSEVEEIGLTLHLDNENFPTVEVRLYRYNGSFCLAVVDGAPVSLVARSSVMELVEAVQTIVLNG